MKSAVLEACDQWYHRLVPPQPDLAPTTQRSRHLRYLSYFSWRVAGFDVTFCQDSQEKKGERGLHEL